MVASSPMPAAVYKHAALLISLPRADVRGGCSAHLQGCSTRWVSGLVDLWHASSTG
jgi:hypothetical protein